jgi:hypothetical protein
VSRWSRERDPATGTVHLRMNFDPSPAPVAPPAPVILRSDVERFQWLAVEAARVDAAGGPVAFYGSRNLRDARARGAAPVLQDDPPPPEEDEGEWLPPLF